MKKILTRGLIAAVLLLILWTPQSASAATPAGATTKTAVSHVHTMTPAGDVHANALIDCYETAVRGIHNGYHGVWMQTWCYDTVRCVEVFVSQYFIRDRPCATQDRKDLTTAAC